ncbi:MAG: hypothetical protein JRI57_01875 [Deltaproteobacteria bacterium]|nr:hypothetical protein [Deltaproteobacteria bacterium]MBW1953160.1 hypothetical protein [Deltaproteobacteria bacterium]MBW1986426.1 hypothetical protein [Deltaproteobacteria bacterium]MBW2133820.1 hypothetical protein [Deltaproteobacteria bacterium]
MSESPLSNEGRASMENFPPAAPTLAEPTFEGRVVKVNVTLPTTDVDGGPLTGLSSCTLFYKTSSFAGSSPEEERNAGTPHLVQEVNPEMAGQTISFTVTDLEYGVLYYFAASCAD